MSSVFFEMGVYRITSTTRRTWPRSLCASPQPRTLLPALLPVAPKDRRSKSRCYGTRVHPGVILHKLGTSFPSRILGRVPPFRPGDVKVHQIRVAVAELMTRGLQACDYSVPQTVVAEIVPLCSSLHSASLGEYPLSSS